MNWKEMKENSSSFICLVAKAYNISKKITKKSHKTHYFQYSYTFMPNIAKHLSPHLPKHQRPGCHTHHFENAPSWCWTGHPEYPEETGPKRKVVFRNGAEVPEIYTRKCGHAPATCHVPRVQYLSQQPELEAIQSSVNGSKDVLLSHNKILHSTKGAMPFPSKDGMSSQAPHRVK